MGFRLPHPPSAAAPAAAPRTPAEWHAYVRSAPTFANAQDRMDEAVRAGVDFHALNALAHRETPDLQERRHG